MYTEAFLWLGLILASPALFMCSKMFVMWVMGFFLCDDVVDITIENEKGEFITKRVHLDKSDELAVILREIQAMPKHSDKGAAL